MNTLDLMKFYNEEIHEHNFNEKHSLYVTKEELSDKAKLFDERKIRQQYNKNYRLKNKEKIKAYNKTYRNTKLNEEIEDRTNKQNVLKKLETLNQKHNSNLTYDSYKLIDYINEDKKHQLFLSFNHRPKKLFYDNTTFEILNQIAKLGEENVTVTFNSYNYDSITKTAEDLKYIQFIAVDVDSLELSLTELFDKIKEEGLPSPNIVTNSGNGYHIFWKIHRLYVTERESLSNDEAVIKETLENNKKRRWLLETLRILQVEIAKKLNGDIAFSSDFIRSTRIPSTLNVKGDNIKEVELLYLNTEIRYNFMKDFDFNEAVAINKEIKEKTYRKCTERKETTFKYKKETLPVLNMSYISDLENIIDMLQTNEEFSFLGGNLEGFRYTLIKNMIFAGANAQKSNSLLVRPLPAHEIEAIIKDKKKTYDKHGKNFFTNVEKILVTIKYQILQKYNRNIDFSDDFILRLRLVKDSEEVSLKKEEVRAEYNKDLKELRKINKDLLKDFDMFVHYNFIKQFRTLNKSRNMEEINKKLEVRLNMSTATLYRKNKNIYINKISNNSLKLSAIMIETNTNLFMKEKYLTKTQQENMELLLKQSIELYQIINENIKQGVKISDLNMSDFSTALDNLQEFNDTYHNKTA